MLQTDHDGALGVAFDDETSLSLNANTRITISNFIYQEGNAGNAGLLERGARYADILRRTCRQDQVT